MFSFHLGKPVLVMLLVALVTGGVIVARPVPPKRDLEFWVFAKSQLSVFREKGKGGEPSLVDIWNERGGRQVDIKSVSMRAMDTRVLSLMMSGAKGDRVPDLVSVDMGSVGKYFRFPPEEVGLLPLDGFLDRPSPRGGTWRSHLLASRVTPWSRGGKVFGIPHDVHPTVITYRKDLFDEAGVDLGACKTWAEFHKAGLEYRNYWASKGSPERLVIELQDSSAEALGSMILQRHINTVDSNLESHLTDPKVLDTVVKYARMVAGPGKIGGDSSPGALFWVNDFRQGAIGAFFTPDWRVNYLRGAAGPSLQGKLAMMPVPIWEPGDAPTTTRGGTMVGILKNVSDPEASWKLIEHFYLSPIALKTRLARIDIVPPVMDTWTDEKFSKPDALYGGQKTGEMLIDLARQVPTSNATPFSSTASGLLGNVLQKQVQMIESGADETTQISYAKRQLEEADAHLKKVIAFSAFK